MRSFYRVSARYIVGSCSVDRLNCSLVIPVSRLRQSDGYQWCLFCGDIVKIRCPVIRSHLFWFTVYMRGRVGLGPVIRSRFYTIVKEICHIPWEKKKVQGNKFIIKLNQSERRKRVVFWRKQDIYIYMCIGFNFERKNFKLFHHRDKIHLLFGFFLLLLLLLLFLLASLSPLGEEVLLEDLPEISLSLLFWVDFRVQ